MLTNILRNRTVYADNVIRQQSVLDGCIPAVPIPPDGANASASIMPVLAGGRVCTTCSEVAEYRAEAPNCSAGPAVIPAPVYDCNLTTIPNLTLYLDANDPLGTGVLPANGTGISTWFDLALPGAKNAVKPASGVPSPPFQTFNPPTFQLALQNGLPGIRFTNGGTSPFQGLVIAAPVTTANYSLFVVGSFTGSLVSSSPIVSGATTQPSPNTINPFRVAYDKVTYSGVTGGTVFTTDVQWPTPPSTLALATPYIFTLVPAASILGINGKDTTGANIPTPDVNLALGMVYDPTRPSTQRGSSGTNCVIHQIMLFDRIVTAYERLRIETCLSRKWGIPLL